MKIFEAAKVHEIDAWTISHEPVPSIELMERAAARLTGWYVRHFHIDRKVMIFAGPGNNGGDAFAMARLLAERQYRVECYLLGFSTVSENGEINRQRLLDQDLVLYKEVRDSEELPVIGSEDVVVDGIFGSGLTRVACSYRDRHRHPLRPLR
jgi:hydroxyethylthiazole kinase-like uncharacterized protein yjeF